MKTGVSSKLFKNTSDYISILATILLLILLFVAGSVLYSGFFSLQVVSNLFIDNAYLIVIVVGETLTIITGGIDLSVGAMVAFVSMIAAQLLQLGVNPILVMLIVLLVGCAFGTFQGILIQKFKLHPWIVTLAGMFFARGASYLISIETIAINNTTFSNIAGSQIPIGFGAYTTDNVIVALLVVVVAVIVMKYTRFGRTVYAIGGNENSAMLMGLPTGRTKILVYTISGFCSSLGGLLFTIYMLSGYGGHCVGTEMDAIAACVVGGILLTGGYGFIIGPMFGVLVTGIIQSLIMFNGTLNSWWTKVAVGTILFLFILLQRIVVIRNAKQKASPIQNENADDLADFVESIPK
jgi:galactofuranose transport system permease protein